MLSFMHAQHSLFQQGHSLLEDIHPYMKTLAAQVRPRPLVGPLVWPFSPFVCVPSRLQLDQLVIDSAVEKREMERKHATVQQRVSGLRPSVLAGPYVWTWGHVGPVWGQDLRLWND